MSKSIFIGLIFITVKAEHTQTTESPGPCIYLSYGANTVGDNQYSQTIKTQSECRSSCDDDTRCQGFSHRGNDDACRLHESTSYQTDACASCFFFSKHCVESSTEILPSSGGQGPCVFVSHGTNTVGDSHYSQTIKTEPECQSSCGGDSRCHGFTHRGSDNTCRLHETTSYQSSGCASCFFFSKNCVETSTEILPSSGIQGPCVFVSHGTNTIGFSHYSQTIKTKSECRSSCEGDAKCQGYTHRGSDDACRLHESTSFDSTHCTSCIFSSKTCQETTSSSVISATTSKSCSNVSFIDHGGNTGTRYIYITLASNSTSECEMMCFNDDLCRAYRFQNGQCKLSASDLIKQSVTPLECEEQCKSDDTCKGYTYISDKQKCALSNIKIVFDSPNCEFCNFYSKQCETDIIIPETCNSTSFIPAKTRFRIAFEYTSENASSYLHCRNLCFEDLMCKDFRFNSTSKVCRRSPSDFHGKKVASLSECESLCSTDFRCVSYVFRADFQRCRMSYLSVSVELPYCKFCLFSAKRCDVVSENSSSLQTNTDQHIFHCYTYQNHGFGVFSISSSLEVYGWTECELLCSSDDSCRSYEYNSTGSSICRLSNVTSLNVSCPLCNFALKRPCEITTMQYLTIESTSPYILTDKDSTTQSESTDINLFSLGTFSFFGSSITAIETTNAITSDIRTKKPTSHMASSSSLSAQSSTALSSSESSTSSSSSTSSLPLTSSFTSSLNLQQETISSTEEKTQTLSTETASFSIQTGTTMHSIQSTTALSSPFPDTQSPQTISEKPTVFSTTTHSSSSVGYPSSSVLHSSETNTEVSPENTEAHTVSSSTQSRKSTSEDDLVTTSSSILLLTTLNSQQTEVSASTNFPAESNTTEEKRTSISYSESTPTSSDVLSTKYTGNNLSSSISNTLQTTNTDFSSTTTNEFSFSESTSSESTDVQISSSEPLYSTNPDSTSLIASTVSTSNTESSISDVQATDIFMTLTENITTTQSPTAENNSQTVTSSKSLVADTITTVSPDTSIGQSDTTSMETTDSTSKSDSSTLIPHVSFLPFTSTKTFLSTKHESSLSTNETPTQSLQTENIDTSTVTTRTYTTDQKTNYPSSMHTDTHTTSFPSGISTEELSTTQKSQGQPVEITNGTVKCICVCKDTKTTLEEAMEERKKKLTVEKKDLSSTTRKRTSAPDFRLASTTIGSVGAGVLVLVVGLISFADICSGILFLYHVFAKLLLKPLLKTLKEKPSIV